MAEGFANHYGRDVLHASSAGLMPVSSIDPRTVEVMQERGVDVSLHTPGYFDPFSEPNFDLIVNLSGIPLRRWPRNEAESVIGLPSVIDWPVKDPYRAEIEIYREVRDEIDRLVMLLILELRRARERSAV